MKFLDKFEKGKKYVFDKKTYEEHSRLTFGRVLGLGWQNQIDGSIVEVTDEDNGTIGLYDVSPEWCKELHKYYNGRVVCLSEDKKYFTKGKIYYVIDGKIKIDDGDKLPMFGHKFKTFEDLVEYFSSYGNRKGTFNSYWSSEDIKFIEVVD